MKSRTLDRRLAKLESRVRTGHDHESHAEVREFLAQLTDDELDRLEHELVSQHRDEGIESIPGGQFSPVIC